MNGIITIDDGAGTVIQNGTIITNNLALNTISAEYPTKDCDLWSNNSGSTYIASNCTGTVSVGMFALGNFNLGPSAFTVTNKNMNFCTATGMSGNITFGSPNATGSKIKLSSPTVECQAVPTIGNSVCNKTYVDAISPSLLAATNIWTGVSNTFNNVIYTSLISTLTSNTMIKNSQALVIGQAPENYVSTGLPVTMTDNGMRFFNSSTNSIMDFFSSGVAGNNNQSSRIRSFGGTAVANSGGLTISSGNIALSATTGIGITTTTGDIN
ncbi:MAG: hypothetical protein WCH21_12830, partial [Bacteroidota bacterium]